MVAGLLGAQFPGFSQGKNYLPLGGLDLLLEHGRVQCPAGVRGGQQQMFQILLAERLRLGHLVDRLENADDLPLSILDRQTQDIAGVIAGFLVYLLECYHYGFSVI